MNRKIKVNYIRSAYNLHLKGEYEKEMQIIDYIFAIKKP